ncbi:MAG: hypothetical protein IIZ59_04000 [Clostridia bacterium]|nr:hypothetical protein [Clostridia bacterium]
MDNPFLIRSTDPSKSDYLTPDCSVNKIRLAKLPIYGIEDDIEGCTVKEIFSVKCVVEEIKKNAEKLGIDPKLYEGVKGKNLPLILVQKVEDNENPETAKLAREIIEKFGSRLGLMLLTLKMGEPENRKARPEWTEAHWNYWAQVKDIILVGGLASGTFGAIMREQINQVFAMHGTEPYNILLYDNSQQVAVLGCASCIREENGVFVVMDFGQTNIKRSFVVKCDGEVTDMKILPSYPSKYMEWNVPDDFERVRQAKALHRYLMNAIENTYKEAERTSGLPGNEIIISIASYTVDGVLNHARSGYAKLCELGSCYAEVLGYELSGILKRDISVKLIHDGTAVALNFKSRDNTVCLAVGSYFGVGFPETRIV